MNNRSLTAGERYFGKIGTGISVSRILLMFFIVAGHVALIPDWFGHYAAGTPYPFAGDAFPEFVTSLAAQPTLADKIFLVFTFNFWSLNFAFYALSGFSLWFSVMRKGRFDLKDYFFNRFFGIYLGFFLAALAAFVCVVVFLGHKPGEHDLNFLLLGVARARETMPYNDTLWFLTTLFALYLFFPAIPALYSKTGYSGVAALFAFLAYFVYHGRALAEYTFLPTACFFFVLGIFAAATLFKLALFIRTDAALRLLSAILAALALFALWRLYRLTYADLLDAGRLARDTHAIGLYAFLAFFLAGFLPPHSRRAEKILRLVARGTFAVYVYHYLFMKLYINHAGFSAFVRDALPQGDGLLLGHILVGSLALYGAFLAAGFAYQYLLDNLIVRRMRGYFAKPLVFAPRFADEKIPAAKS